MKLITTNIFSLLLLLISNIVLGAATQLPEIRIESDKAMINPKGVTLFTGHVSINQGNLTIQADNVQLTHSTNQAQATGAPVTFQHTVNKQRVNGTANKLTYQPHLQTIVLVGAVHIQNGMNMASGEQMIYHINTQELEIHGTNSNKAKLIIYPNEQGKQ